MGRSSRQQESQRFSKREGRLLEAERLPDHSDRLFRAAYALCGTSHDAEDLVQETYARVLRRPRFIRRDGCPNGEMPADVAARCDRVIAELLEIDGDVAIVGHGHILRALAARWIEDPVATGGRLFLSTGSISVLGFEREVRVIRSWNA